MSITSIRKFLFDKIKLDIINGKITGIPELPSDEFINAEIEKVLSSSNNGIIGSLNKFNRKDISNVDNYNKNFLTIKDNIEYILGEIYASLNNVIDIVNDATLEKNQVLRDIKMIDQDFSDIEAGTLHNDGLKYVVSDNFIDTEKIDLSRSTAQFNLNAGSVTLNPLTSQQLSFPHYRKQNTMEFTITEGFSQIKSQRQTPGTKFSDIFTSDDLGRWELVIETFKPVNLEGFFTIKLSDIGNEEEINSVKMKIYSTKNISNDTDLLTLYYMNPDKSNRGWKILPGGKVDINSSEIELEFPAIKTTHLKLVWTKYYPDDLEHLQYLFSITELSVRKNTSSYESVIISQPLIIQPYQNEQPTIYMAEIETKQKTQAGTDIEYYVAVDEPIPGKIVDSNDNIVDANSDSAESFVPNGTDPTTLKPETYYTYASLLRDNAHISGVYPYQYWEPKWQRITSKTKNTSSIPNQLFFNVSDYDKEVHDLYYTNPYLWGDPSYEGPWPVDGQTDWAGSWSGGTGDFPKSGYIWGENPFTPAGVWWGDAHEYAGWWRPLTPTNSGTLTITPDVSIPDFVVPVMSGGIPYYDENGNPLQKHFWKIFKWPETSLPIPGTVKIYNKNLTLDNETMTNDALWKWNYKSRRVADDYSFSDYLKSNTSIFNIQLDQLLIDRSDLRIIPGSIRDINFKGVTPSLIEDYIIEYGYEYFEDSDGYWQKREVDDELKEARAAIVFNKGVISERRGPSNSGIIDISMTLSYECKSDISASWDGFLFVPEIVENNPPNLYISDVSGHVKKITVQQISDDGIVLENKEIVKISKDDITNTEIVKDNDLYKGLNLVRVFVDVEPTQNDDNSNKVALWKPNDFWGDIKAVKFDKNVYSHNAGIPLREVDINVLLYETDYNDDTRFALLDDVDSSKYLVIKTPYSGNFPSGIVNSGHFTRTYLNSEGTYITFTTGTSGNEGSHPITLDGKILADRPANTSSTVSYPNISTYGETIQVDNNTGSGFLFWDTAENLESVFDIKYAVPVNNRPCDRVFVMAKLKSNDVNISPILNSYSLIINNKLGV